MNRPNTVFIPPVASIILFCDDPSQLLASVRRDSISNSMSKRKPEDDCERVCCLHCLHNEEKKKPKYYKFRRKGQHDVITCKPLRMHILQSAPCKSFYDKFYILDSNKLVGVEEKYDYSKSVYEDPKVASKRRRNPVPLSALGLTNNLNVASAAGRLNGRLDDHVMYSAFAPHVDPQHIETCISEANDPPSINVDDTDDDEYIFPPNDPDPEELSAMIIGRVALKEPSAHMKSRIKLLKLMRDTSSQSLGSHPSLRVLTLILLIMRQISLWK